MSIWGLKYRGRWVVCFSEFGYFAALFFRVVDVVFCRGFLQIAVRKRVNLRGETWWDCGENVVENSR
jgi:hypothetical protein